ncbi:Glutathione S-transferase T1 (AtGSTT1) (GST class-theta member 1) (Glutathione S-transferase 10) [Durusdinium trenchii]|uniref:Glutathione S-transferase T1 (AtGSTT1) (GST class-theta member 1) (Glutathione S-transferase 10) n=1 Tax=Durusdinium trenchii TaxID=1381693 RepID=A0ABP0K4T2_9DINO
MKIYTMPISQPCRALSWACAYENVQVEEVQTMPGKDTRSKEFQAQGVIPAVPRLEEDGFILNESHAIMAYLGDKFEWKLYPRDARIRARIHQYMNWHHQNTRRITMALFAPVMRPDLKISPEQTKQWMKEIAQTLQSIERWLNENPWLCGPAPTVADLSCYCEVGQCLDKFTGLFKLNGIDLLGYPKLTQWTPSSNVDRTPQKSWRRASSCRASR